MSNAIPKWTKLLSGAVKFLPEAGWVTIVVELLTQLANAMGVTSGDSKETLKHIEALRGELGQMTAAHDGLSAQLIAQHAMLATHVEALATQTARIDALSADMESLKHALEKQQQDQRRSFGILLTGTGVALALLIALVILAGITLHHVLQLH
jgi:septal ring factor EnvC (AmiA/AmiB activator)